MERTALFTIRVTPEELAMAKRLAEADGISASDLIRQFVRREHRERFPEPGTATPKRRHRKR